ncbi:Protein of unknown function [Pyronema omphalodes CBS 100304]|uniref:Uncharacterized protein n=1 Tax=Pyronema omphalodes (strain CBS 100304) TaxID=1076935 RepID=U4KYT4_PYROM|nr:Protein of unknown function [Pyronema omphalodes CBS 100304]
MATLGSIRSSAVIRISVTRPIVELIVVYITMNHENTRLIASARQAEHSISLTLFVITVGFNEHRLNYEQ